MFAWGKHKKGKLHMGGPPFFSNLDKEVGNLGHLLYMLKYYIYVGQALLYPSILNFQIAVPPPPPPPSS